MHEPVFKARKKTPLAPKYDKVLVWGHRRLGNSRICVHPSIFSSFWLKSSSGNTLQMFGGVGGKLPRCLNSLHNTRANKRRVTAPLIPSVSRPPLRSLSARKGLFQRSLIVPLRCSAGVVICCLCLRRPTSFLFSFVLPVLTLLAAAYYHCSESAIIVQPSARSDLHLRLTPLNQSCMRRCFHASA